ncbi:TonB-dependent receptor [Sphingobium sp. EP60837]|uniref:TonB-dependent receptor n=1 Tax=Sphingobium sp. EP60837 TaxID=1855519 RepID=UPI0007DCFEE3|nr:TonB-dependent receptor [Sphingobium sp. EP60837]ANI80188.1 Pesticin receptor [Sphingobium sp. EP60837]
MKRTGRVSLAALVMGILAHDNSAFAQSGPGAPDAADQQQEKASAIGQLTDIIVTAQFKSENVQKAPLAITAVNAEMLEARSQSSVTDVANRAPSVQLSTGGQGGGSQTAAVAIRGIGTNDFQFPVEPGVGIYIDDVYYGISFGSSFDLVDLDRVEILRGPQGTLSGKNSIGGSIKLFSRAPGPDPDAYVEGTYGSFNRLSVKAASNFTLVPERLYARFTGMARHVAGYMKRYDYGCVTGRNAPGGNFAPGAGNCKIGTEGGQEVYAVRGALRWIASDRIEDHLVVDFTQDRSEASPAKLLLQHDFGNGNNYITGPKDYTSYANYTGHPGTADQFTVPAISHLKSWGIANTLDVRLNESLSLKSITAFRKSSGQNAWDGDASPESVFNNFNVFTHKQFTQELRLSTSLGSLVDATLGGYYYDADSTLGGRIDVEAAGLEFAFDDPFKQTSKSGFLHVVVHPSSRLNITGGIRYTKEDKDYTFTRFSPIPGQPTSPFVAPLDGVQRSFSGSRWDYRIAIDYEIADDIRPYAQVATGFKGGGINPRPFFVSQAVTFGQEKVTSYEIGLKTMLLDRRLRLNGAIYQTDYKDYQAQLLFCPDLSPPGLGNNCAATQNVADAKIHGFEVEGEFQPVDGLSIDGSVSYVDFKFRNIDPASGLTANTRPQFSPKWKYAIGAQYRADLGGHGSLTPRLDWAYRSSIESNAINSTPGFMMGHVNAVGLLNARLTYRSPDEDWEASLAVTNVTDKFYYINKYDREAGFNTVFGQPGRPREWMVSIKRKF